MMIGGTGASPPLTAINSSVESTSSVKLTRFFMVEYLEIDNSLD